MPFSNIRHAELSAKPDDLLRFYDFRVREKHETRCIASCFCTDLCRQIPSFRHNRNIAAANDVRLLR
ncbi:MAG: hypothetical protein LBH00_01075 [Planctomycetaceae bacterium]|nr:hypothetical protein [Planctomycetaceae bacterium]